jgi:hypothetical protein
MKVNTRIHGWQDAVEILIIAWLFISPFALGFFGTIEASLTAVSIAAISSLFVQLGIATENPANEWVNLFLAFVLIASPWLFGYSALAVASWNAVATGLMLGLFAILAMNHDYADRKNPEVHAFEDQRSRPLA